MRYSSEEFNTGVDSSGRKVLNCAITQESWSTLWIFWESLFRMGTPWYNRTFWLRIWPPGFTPYPIPPHPTPHTQTHTHGGCNFPFPSTIAWLRSCRQLRCPQVAWSDRSQRKNKALYKFTFCNSFKSPMHKTQVTEPQWKTYISFQTML